VKQLAATVASWVWSIVFGAVYVVAGRNPTSPLEYTTVLVDAGCVTTRHVVDNDIVGVGIAMAAVVSCYLGSVNLTTRPRPKPKVPRPETSEQQSLVLDIQLPGGK
jgi:hypothetical protein